MLLLFIILLFCYNYRENMQTEVVFKFCLISGDHLRTPDSVFGTAGLEKQSAELQKS